LAVRPLFCGKILYSKSFLFTSTDTMIARSCWLDFKEVLRALGGERTRWFVLALVAMVILFAQASRTRLTTDAIVYAGISRAIADTGDYLTLRVADELYYYKPPLGFWLAALSIKVFGPTPLAVTLFSRLFGLASVLLTARLGTRLYGARIGWVAGLALVTSYLFMHASITFRLDSIIIFGILLSFIAYFSEKKWGPPVFYLGVTIAVLAKGPAGLLPLIVAPLHTYLYGDRSIWAKSIFRWLAWSPLLLLPLSWWVYLFLHEGTRPLFMIYNELFRTRGGIKSTFTSFWKIYFLEFSMLYWPWLPFAWIGAWTASRSLWNPEIDRQTRSAAGFVLMWIAVVLAACALKKAQYLRYIILALPAISILSAKAIVEIGREKIFDWLPGTVAVLAFIAVIFLACFPPPPVSSQSAEYAAMAEILNRRLPPKAPVSLLKLKPKRDKGVILTRPEKGTSVFFFDRPIKLVSVNEAQERAKTERVTLLIRRNEVRRIRELMPIEVLFAGSLHAVAEATVP
jgi:4-amino-4-deoxy-L-arabinose transferase-like glycosyltransferase